MTILENRTLLQKLTNSFVKDSSAESERVCLALLKALIPIGRFMLRHSLRTAFDGGASAGGESSRPMTPTFITGDLVAPPTTNGTTTTTSTGASTPAAGSSAGFPQLMVIMATLAGAGRSGKGHAILFKAALEWTNLCKSRFSRRDLASVIRGGDDDEEADEVVEAVLPGGDMRAPLTSATASKACLESICFLLSYVGEILGALKLTSSNSGKTDGDGEQHDWMMGAAPGMDSELYYLMEGKNSVVVSR